VNVSDVPGWSYAVLSLQNLELRWLEERLTKFGEEGWELAVSVAPNKAVALVGNQLVFVFKKPGVGHKPPSFSDAGSEMLF
jgi:hypothetical protein